MPIFGLTEEDVDHLADWALMNDKERENMQRWRRRGQIFLQVILVLFVLFAVSYGIPSLLLLLGLASHEKFHHTTPNYVCT